MFVAHSLTHRANRSISSRSKSPAFRNFPNTLSEAFLIAFRYGDDWLQRVCQRAGFNPRIVREADGAATALAFVAAGLGVALTKLLGNRNQSLSCRLLAIAG